MSLKELEIENKQLHGKILELRNENALLTQKIVALEDDLENSPNCDDCDLAGACDTAQYKEDLD